MNNSNTHSALNTLLLSIRSRRRLRAVFENDIKWEIALFVMEAHLTNKSIDISGLTHVIGKARNTVTLQVEIMESEGYLVFDTDVKDMRRKVISPTETLVTEFDMFAKAVAPDIARASFKLQSR